MVVRAPARAGSRLLRIWLVLLPAACSTWSAGTRLREPERGPRSTALPERLAAGTPNAAAPAPARPPAIGGACERCGPPAVRRRVGPQRSPWVERPILGSWGGPGAPRWFVAQSSRRVSRPGGGSPPAPARWAASTTAWPARQRPPCVDDEERGPADRLGQRRPAARPERPDRRKEPDSSANWVAVKRWCQAHQEGEEGRRAHAAGRFSAAITSSGRRPPAWAARNRKAQSKAGITGRAALAVPFTASHRSRVAGHLQHAEQTSRRATTPGAASAPRRPARRR